MRDDIREIRAVSKRAQGAQGQASGTAAAHARITPEEIEIMREGLHLTAGRVLPVGKANSIDALCDMAAAYPKLVAALRNMGAEVCGVLSLAELEMRAAAGNTNVECLQRREKEALSLLRELGELDATGSGQDTPPR